MSDTTAGWLQVAALVLLLAVSYRPLGDYMAHILTSKKHWRGEKVLYKAMGVDAEADQTWGVYLRSVLAISAVGVLLLYLLLRVQDHLMLALGMPKMQADLAYNTAASFVTNTNWQNYSGENTLGYVAQMTGLAVQNFVSASVGIAVVATLIRGFTRSRTDRVGNFWVDLTRIVIRLMLPVSLVFAIVLIATGVTQELSGHLTVVHTLNGNQALYTGPTASQEAIKEFGTNGGGIFNANSAHPFENPNGFSNLIEIYLLLVIGFSLPRTFGKMVGSAKQGYAIVAVMAAIWMGSLAFATFAETHHQGVNLATGHAALEGKEMRFGVPASALFMTSTTLTSTGAVNSMHDSFTPLGGGAAMFNIMLGEIAPGGTGSGLYGMLILADRHRVHRGPDGRAHPGVPGQEDPPGGDEVRRPVHPDHPGDRADLRRDRDGAARRDRAHDQHRPARLLRGPLRLHLDGQQQRLGLRRAWRQHHLVEHRRGAGDAVRPLPADGVGAGAGRIAGQAAARARSPRARSRPPARCSSGCCWAPCCSSSASPTSRPCPSGRSLKDCTDVHLDPDADPRRRVPRRRSRTPSPRRIGGGFLDPKMLWKSLPDAAAASSTRGPWSRTRSCSWSRPARS